MEAAFASEVLGWANYDRIAHELNRVANQLGYLAFWIAVRALCCRYELTITQCIRRYRCNGSLSMSERRMQENLARPVWGWGPGEIPGPTPRLRKLTDEAAST